MRAKKAPDPVLLPEADHGVRRWVVLGLDPSMSRTGFSVLSVDACVAHTPEEGPYTQADWLTAGSVKPEKADDGLHPRTTLWARGKAMAMYLREVAKAVGGSRPGAGLIVSMEYPTPMNDYLVALNRIIHLVFFEDDSLVGSFGRIRVLTTNASTLRSLMRLTKKGAQNKGENIQRAYEYIGRDRFPELDSDACDAVLLAMMGRYAASLLLGCPSEVPASFLASLCSGAQDVKGKGRNARTVTRGILHRAEYWYPYERRLLGVLVKDASSGSKRLGRASFEI